MKGRLELSSAPLKIKVSSQLANSCKTQASIASLGCCSAVGCALARMSRASDRLPPAAQVTPCAPAPPGV